MSDAESRILPWPGPGRPPGPGPWPGWRPPTGAWPPGPLPPGPGPFPQPPDVFSAFAWLAKNYQESQAAKAFLKLLIQDLIAEDPAFLANAQATVGVTDGSQAQAGMVGERIGFGGTFAYTDGVTTGSVTMGVLQPGDWDLYGSGGLTTVVDGATFSLDPLPPGIVGDVAAGLNQTVANPEGIFLVSSMAMLTTASPVLLVLKATVNTSAGTGPGTLDLVIFARRRR